MLVVQNTILASESLELPLYLGNMSIQHQQYWHDFYCYLQKPKLTIAQLSEAQPLIQKINASIITECDMISRQVPLC